METTARRQSGLAALELVIVVTVLVLLTGVLVPSIERVLRTSRQRDAATAMRHLADGIRRYHRDTGRWPVAPCAQGRKSSCEVAAAYACLRQDVEGVPGWDGPYVSDADAALLDPWGHPYVIFSFAADYCHSGGGISIVSGGPDGHVQTRSAAILAGTAVQDDLVEVAALRL